MRKRLIPFPFVEILILLLPPLFTGCAGLKPLERTTTMTPPTAVISPDTRNFLRPDSYSAAHSFYCGVLIPLDLTSFLPLSEKFRILKAVFSRGDGQERSRSVDIRVPGYFTRGDLIIRSVYHPEPPRLHWLSNAVYSPLTGGALRGRGEFLSKDTQPGNISDMVFLHEGFAVRITEIHTVDRETLYQRKREYNNLADLYLHDGRPENDHTILPLLRQAFQEAPSPLHRVVVELTGIQYLTSRGKYEEAKDRLRRLVPLLPTLQGELKNFFRYTYEEYALTRSLDEQNLEDLIEFKDFLYSEKGGEHQRDNTETDVPFSGESEF